MADEPTSPQASEPETAPGKPPDTQKEYPLEMLEAIPNGTMFSYNLDDTKTPGGLKVRWKIRVATGAEGARWDARQAEAIKELLQWAQEHQRLATTAR